MLSAGSPGGRGAEVSPPAEAAGDQAAQVRPQSLEDVSARHRVGRRRPGWRALAYEAGALSVASPRNGADSSRADRRSRGITTFPRASVLEIFAPDRGHSVLRIPLDERRRQIEAIPWVEQATVRRALPESRFEVEIIERTPDRFFARRKRHGAGRRAWRDSRPPARR